MNKTLLPEEADTAKAKLTALLNFIKSSKMTTKDYFAIGIDTWRDRGIITEELIREKLSAALLSIVEQKQVE